MAKAGGIKITFDLTSLKGVRERLSGLADATALQKTAGDILFNQATLIMNASKPLVPVDTGFLVQSGHVQIPQVQGNRVTVTLGYAAEYAIYVHENLNARHTTGSAKYLEIPYLAWKQGALQVISDAFRAARSIGIGTRALGA
jgi:hypothetical protein